MITHLHRALLFLVMLLASGAASAHEVRPAMLDLRQTGPATYSVIWKRPVTGDVGVRLVPHLSSGWLDSPPSDYYSDGGFLIESWTVTDASPGALDQATVRIEGLQGTLIDVFVRVTFPDGRRLESIVRAASPQLQIEGPRAPSGGRWQFVKLGIHHILSGPDHLLFLLGLLMMARGGWTLLKTISGFTLAHSLTLAIATLWRLDLPVSMLNTFVALSIVFLALELMRARSGGTSLSLRQPMIPAFGFGLLHGLAFATGLSSLDLRGEALIGALLQFNVGVEVGQLVFVAVILALLRAMRGTRIQWPSAAVIVSIYLIGIAGAAWMFQCGVAVLEGQ